MDGSFILMMILMACGAMAMPMFCYLIARKKGRSGKNWFVISALMSWFAPVFGAITSLILTAVMPKVGEPISGPNDKKILIGGFVCLFCLIGGFGLLVPAIMTIVSAVKL